MTFICEFTLVKKIPTDVSEQKKRICHEREESDHPSRIQYEQYRNEYEADVETIDCVRVK